MEQKQKAVACAQHLQRTYVLALFDPCDDTEPIELVATGDESRLPAFHDAIAGFNRRNERKPTVTRVLAIFPAPESQ